MAKDNPALTAFRAILPEALKSQAEALFAALSANARQSAETEAQRIEKLRARLPDSLKDWAPDIQHIRDQQNPTAAEGILVDLIALFVEKDSAPAATEGNVSPPQGS